MNGDAYQILNVITSEGMRVLQIPYARTTLRLSELLQAAGIPLNTRCGQRAQCQGCMIELVAGTLHPFADHDATISPPVHVRGCDVTFTHHPAPVTIRIPYRSQLSARPTVVRDFDATLYGIRQPIWRAADLASGEPAMEYSDQGWRPSALRVVERPVGAIVDIGTTTVALAIIDLHDGRLLGESTALNAQAIYGDNVVTRIEACMSDQRMVEKLQRILLEETLVPLLNMALSAARCSIDQLTSLVVAGNTVMLHLLVGENPASMGSAPFAPQFCHYKTIRAEELLHSVSPSQRVQRRPVSDLASLPTHLLPSAGAFVGADIVAGIWSSGMAHTPGPALLVDLGTNGEIVLKHGDRYWGCATAAGPAFEGVGLRSGSRAIEGAIAHIDWQASEHRLTIETIGQAEPIGICGTAYLDLLAIGRQRGWLTSTGRLCCDHIPADICDNSDRSIVVAQNQVSGVVRITESDIAHLLQAKSAIAAGCLCLLNVAGVAPDQVRHVFVAGGFGFHLRVSSMLRCGLLPELPAAAIHLVGNTSLGGAYQALLDFSIIEQLSALARRIKIVELNLLPEFEDTYIDQMLLP